MTYEAFIIIIIIIISITIVRHNSSILRMI